MRRAVTLMSGSDKAVVVASIIVVCWSISFSRYVGSTSRETVDNFGTIFGRLTSRLTYPREDISKAESSQSSKKEIFNHNTKGYVVEGSVEVIDWPAHKGPFAAEMIQTKNVPVILRNTSINSWAAMKLWNPGTPPFLFLPPPQSNLSDLYRVSVSQVSTRNTNHALALSSIHLCEPEASYGTTGFSAMATPSFHRETHSVSILETPITIFLFECWGQGQASGDSGRSTALRSIDTPYTTVTPPPPHTRGDGEGGCQGGRRRATRFERVDGWKRGHRSDTLRLELQLLRADLWDQNVLAISAIGVCKTEAVPIATS